MIQVAFVDAPADRSQPLFSALLDKRRSRWPWAAGLCVLVLGGGVLFARRTNGAYRVVTPYGIRVLRRGMREGDVRAVLGSGPIATNRGDDGMDCLIYGRPLLRAEPFSVYEACYRGERLLKVTERLYSAQTIDPEVLRQSVQAPAPGPPDPAPPSSR